MTEVSQKGRELHSQAERARETQKPLEALALADEATLAYQEDGDLRGFTEAIGTRVLTFRHLYDFTHDDAWLWRAKAEAEVAVIIAESLDDLTARALPYRNLGGVYKDLKRYEDAAAVLQKAYNSIQNHPPQEHARPAVVSEMKAWLAHALYMSGDTEKGLQYMDEAIQELTDNSEELRYNRDVWLSGAHMKAAEMLHASEPQKSENHLQKAKDIIDSNAELTIRKAQWEALSKELSS